MPRKVENLFDNFMNRLSARADELVEDFLDTAEEEVDYLIQDIQNKSVNQGPVKVKKGKRAHLSNPHAQRRTRPPNAAAKSRPLTCYDILEVSPRASQETIHVAYRSLAKRFHPDQFQDTEEKERMTSKMQFITVAYGVLKDPVKRAAYDREIRR